MSAGGWGIVKWGNPPICVRSKVLRMEENGVFFLDNLDLLISGNTAVSKSDDGPSVAECVSKQAATITAGECWAEQSRGSCKTSREGF